MHLAAICFKVVPLAAMDAKRRRIQGIAGLGGVTDSALRQIAAKFRDDAGLLELVRKPNNVGRATASIMDAIGQIDDLAMESGAFSWCHAEPQKLLQYFVDNSRGFADLLSSKLQQSPSTYQQPWHLVLYCDEITPGNVLRPNNRRKVHAFYFSCRELGRDILCHAEAWLPVAVLRATVVKDVNGRLSHALCVLLQRFFAGPQGMSTAGVVLCFSGQPMVFFAKLGNLLGDEAALKACWGSKGAAGLLPRFLCKNITTHDVAEFDRAGYLVDIACCDAGKMDLATNAQVWEKCDLLEASHAAMTRVAFDNLEKSVGFSRCPNGILANRDLRRFVCPIDVHTYDSMHCAFANGIAHVELHLFLQRAKQFGVKFAHIESFLAADCRWPADKGSKGKALASVFNKVREASSSHHFKASATEILMLYPVIRLFITTTIARSGNLTDEVRSFCCMCRVLDILQLAKKNIFGPNDLAQAIKEHLQAFVRTYTASEVKPKHHFMVHIPAQIARDGLLLDCFVLERKHQMLKACCNWIDNTSAFERSAIARAVQEQCRELEQPGWNKNGLQGKSEEFPDLARLQGAGKATIASRLHVHSVDIAREDVVSIGDLEFIVRCCVSLDGRFCLLVDPLVRVSEVASKTWKCKLRAELHIVDCAVHVVRQVACWTFEADGHVLVLL